MFEGSHKRLSDQKREGRKESQRHETGGEKSLVVVGITVLA